MVSRAGAPAATASLYLVLADGGGAFHWVCGIEAQAKGHPRAIVWHGLLVLGGIHKRRRFAPLATLNASPHLWGGRVHKVLVERGVDLLLELTLPLGLRVAEACGPALVWEGLVGLTLPD